MKARVTSHVPTLIAGAIVVHLLVRWLGSAGVFGDFRLPPIVEVVFDAATLLAALLLIHQAGQLFMLRARVEELQSDLEQLEACLSAAPDPYCGWSQSGAMAISENFAALLGLESVRRLEDIQAVLEPGDAAALDSAYERLEAQGDAFELSVRTVARDGQPPRILTVSGARGVAEAGTDPVTVLWLHDVTLGMVERAELLAQRDEAEAERIRLQAALHAIPAPVWLRGDDLSLVWVNRAMAEALDTSPAGAIANQQELLPTGDGSGANMARQALATGQPQIRQGHVIMAGSRRLAAVQEIPLPDGRTSLGIAQDLTAQEETAAELERHVAAHKEVLEHLGSGIAIYGADTRLAFHNQAYAQQWGLDEGWLNGHPSYGEVLEELRSRRKLPEYANFLSFKREQMGLFTSLIEPQESLLHLPDGATYRVLVVAHPMGGLLFVQEDVSNTLALESSYNTLMAVQQETLDNLAEGVAVFGSDGRIKLYNPAFARIWDLPGQALQARPHIGEYLDRIRHFLPPTGNWSAMREDMIAHLMDRSGRSGRMARTDGSVIEFANVPLPDGAVLYSVLDVTDSARVEQALRSSNAALETADRLKSEFIANVSYQLRTPLNAMMGFSEVLANEYFGPLNPRQRGYTRSILEAGDALLQLINDILDLATIEAGYMQMTRMAVPVRPLLDSVAELTRQWLLKQKLDIRVDCPAEIGSVYIDQRRIKQVLYNLVSNAMKFTPAGGQVTLSARRGVDVVTLTVSDTGIGIPEEDRQRVFNKFEKASSGPRHGGVGLGLSLVKSFVELHGGEVRIDSQQGVGSQISCILPGTIPADAEAEEVSLDDPARARPLYGGAIADLPDGSPNGLGSILTAQ